MIGVGAEVTRWQVGDRVVQMPHPACGRCAMCVRGRDNLCLDTAYPGHQLFGGYAELIARPEDAVLPLAPHVSFEAAAATMWAYTTPLNCVTRCAPVGIGDTAIVFGASGAMATAYAQLGRLAGATVIGTTTKLDRADELRAIGYDHVLGSEDPDLPQQVRALTGGLGADAAWDCIGGQRYFALSAACTRLGGAIAVLASPLGESSGTPLQMATTQFIAGEQKVAGVRAATRRDQQVCLTLLERGSIAPVIDRVLPLAEAAEAHALLESRQQIGKIVLRP